MKNSVNLSHTARTASGKAAGPPVLLRRGQMAPDFTLADVTGKKRHLADLRGRPVALLFFCGCESCRAVAREWAELQRGGALAILAPELATTASSKSDPGARDESPLTLIVYSGPVEAVRALARDTALDPGQTLLLPDSELKVTETVYATDPCPRVFVLGRDGCVTYVNDGADDKPREAPALVIAARTLSALREVALTPTPGAGSAVARSAHQDRF